MTMTSRTRTRLSMDETNAIWIYTATNNMFRFFEGRWQCSHNVYYGADAGWSNWSTEPRAYGDNKFIEMPLAAVEHMADARLRYLDLGEAQAVHAQTELFTRSIDFKGNE